MPQVMKTVTFYTIFVTVLINGGACAELLKRLMLINNPEDDDDPEKARPPWQPYSTSEGP